MKIIVGTPMRDHSVGGAHHWSMWPLMRSHLDGGPTFDILDPKLLTDDDLVRARSRIVRSFLRDTDGDKLLMVDADVSANVTALRGMIAEEVDCIGATYPKKRINDFGRCVDFAVSIPGGAPIEGNRASVHAIGMGFMLLSRELLAAMTEDYDEELGADDEDERTTMLFMLKFGENRGRRVLWPEDFSFCSRVREYTDVWLYTGPGAPLSHEGHHVFHAQAEDIHPRRVPDIAYEDEGGQQRRWGDDRP